MRYIKKENGVVVAASEVEFDETYELADEEYELGFDGKLYSESEMKSEDYLSKKLIYEKETSLVFIRTRRESECFSIINRGTLWHDKLSTQQKSELSEWYEAWLDAPQTGSAPDRPAWLDNVAKQEKRDKLN